MRNSEVDGEREWLCAAVDTESKPLSKTDVYGRHGTDPAAAFLARLIGRHNIPDTQLLVGVMSYAGRPRPPVKTTAYRSSRRGVGVEGVNGGGNSTGGIRTAVTLTPARILIILRNPFQYNI